MMVCIECMIVLSLPPINNYHQCLTLTTNYWLSPLIPTIIPKIPSSTKYHDNLCTPLIISYNGIGLGYIDRIYKCGRVGVIWIGGRYLCILIILNRLIWEIIRLCMD